MVLLSAGFTIGLIKNQVYLSSNMSYTADLTPCSGDECGFTESLVMVGRHILTIH